LHILQSYVILLVDEEVKQVSKQQGANKMAKQVTARQAKAAENAMSPAVQKAMKASRKAAKEREAARAEELQVRINGAARQCTKCGLHYRSHETRELCLNCLG
jgi:hypothetical protein